MLLIFCSDLQTAAKDEMSDYWSRRRTWCADLDPGSHRFTAVDNVSFGIEEGEVVCLVGGKSGCGKTTTGKMIGGLLAD